jgi:hypothetical protein
MKKFTVILGVIVLFFLANAAYAQDCGKCPLKCKAKKKVEKKVTDPVVYAKKGDGTYHQKTCKLVKDGYKGIKLSEAVKTKIKPCPECKPPVLDQVLPPPPAKTEKKDEDKK